MLLIRPPSIDDVEVDRLVGQALSKLAPTPAEAPPVPAEAPGAAGAVEGEAAAGAVADSLLAGLGVAIMAILAAVALPGDVPLHKIKKEPKPKEMCPWPTGFLPIDAIAMTWFKVPIGNFYPSPINLQGQDFFRDVPAHLPRGEPIGVEPKFWPFTGKTVQLLLDEREPGRQTEKTRDFRRVLSSYGFNWGPAGRAGWQVDHVQDPQWGGPDSPENFWPMDAVANASAGALQNVHQRVNFCETPFGPERLQQSIQTIKDDGTGWGRWFVIASMFTPC
jgi:hypothetical protein